MASTSALDDTENYGEASVPFTVFIPIDDSDSVSVANSDITMTVAFECDSWDDDGDVSSDVPSQIDTSDDRKGISTSSAGQTGECEKNISLEEDEGRCEIEDISYSLSIEDGTYYNETGTLHFQRGNYPLALRAYDAALESFRCACERECANPNEARENVESFLAMASTLRNIAAVYWKMGNLRLSVAYLEDSLRIQEDAAGAQADDKSIPVDLARTLLKLGSVECLRGKYGKATRSLRRARGIFEAAYGPAHFHIAEIDDELGKVHLISGRTEEALKYHSNALRIKQDFLEPHHPSVISSLMNVAHVHRKCGNFDETEALYFQAVRAQKMALSRMVNPSQRRMVSTHINKTMRLIKQVQRERECHNMIATIHLGDMRGTKARTE